MDYNGNHNVFLSATTISSSILKINLEMIEPGVLELTFDNISNMPMFTPEIKYGGLYNYYAITDSRQIANEGWHVPTQTEWLTLRDYCGGESVAGYRLRSAETEYWDTIGSDQYGFKARGSGYASTDYVDGNFIGYTQLKESAYFRAIGIPPDYPGFTYGMYIGLGPSFFESYPEPQNGISVRLIKDTTTLSNGETGEYIGNDGKRYPTICIGTQEWLSVNLCETRFRNNEPLELVTTITGFDQAFFNGHSAYGYYSGNTLNGFVESQQLTSDSLTDWNNYFNLPNKGNPFTSVIISGNTVKLYGGSNIILEGVLNNQHLISVIDNNTVIGLNNHSINNNSSLNTVKLNNVTTIGNACLTGNPSITNISLKSCTTLGSTVKKNNILLGIVNKTVTLTINETLYTCNNGYPDEDLLVLMSVNTCIIYNENNIVLIPTPINSINMIYFQSYHIPVADKTSLTDWNAYFNLPTKGSPFFNISLDMEDITLYNIGTIKLKQSIFNGVTMYSFNSNKCVSTFEPTPFYNSVVISITMNNLTSLPNDVFDGMADLFSASLPDLTSVQPQLFSNKSIDSVYLPSVTSLPNNAFENTSFTYGSIISVPNCVNFGSTVGNDSLFNCSGSFLYLKIPSTLMTCNGGQPDGDIQYLIDNNSVTITDPNSNQIYP